MSERDEWVRVMAELFARIDDDLRAMFATPEPAKYGPCSCACGCQAVGAAIAGGRCAWCATEHKEKP